MAGDNRLVTENFLRLNFSPQIGVTPGTDDLISLDCDQIRTRYRATVNGVTVTGTRCPSQNQLTANIGDPPVYQGDYAYYYFNLVNTPPLFYNFNVFFNSKSTNADIGNSYNISVFGGGKPKTLILTYFNPNDSDTHTWPGCPYSDFILKHNGNVITPGPLNYTIDIEGIIAGTDLNIDIEYNDPNNNLANVPAYTYLSGALIYKIVDMNGNIGAAEVLYCWVRRP